MNALLDGRRGEGVAGLERALAVAGLEPLHAGGGRAVGPLLLVDLARRLLLDPVVTDGLGGLDGLLDVSVGEVDDQGLAVGGVGGGGVLGPHAGVAVGLQLQAYGVAV